MAKYTLISSNEQNGLGGYVTVGTTLMERLKLAYYALRYPSKVCFFMAVSKETAAKMWVREEPSLDGKVPDKKVLLPAKVIDLNDYRKTKGDL